MSQEKVFCHICKSICKKGNGFHPEKCECKEMSCQNGCSINHTHKGFFCEKCEPEAYEKMEPNQETKCCGKCIDRKTAIELLGNENIFWAKTKTNSDGCINWLSTKSKNGYGVLTLKGRQWKAHRVAVALWGRFVPHNLVCDHICRNTKCVNPTHIRIVTSAENVMVGESFTAKNAKKKECLNGHPYSEFGGTTKRKNGKVWRWCRYCENEKDKIRKRIIREKTYAKR